MYSEYGPMFESAFGRDTDNSWDDFDIIRDYSGNGSYLGGSENDDKKVGEDFLKELSKYIESFSASPQEIRIADLRVSALPIAGGSILAEVVPKMASRVADAVALNEESMATIITSIPMAPPPNSGHNDTQPASESFTGGASGSSKIDFDKYVERFGGDDDQNDLNDDSNRHSNAGVVDDFDSRFVEYPDETQFETSGRISVESVDAKLDDFDRYTEPNAFEGFVESIEKKSPYRGTPEGLDRFVEGGRLDNVDLTSILM